MLRNTGFYFLIVYALLAGSTGAYAQAAAASEANASSNNTVMVQLMTLRDSFVNQIKTEGFQPSLPAPRIILDNPPSYGNYEDAGNILHIAIWTALKPEQQARFSRLALIMGGEQTGEQAFEESVHQWVFIHELSHWWQACQRKPGENHYSVEYGANRIAASYWQLKDPAFMDRTAKRMAMVWPTMPNPVPEGQAEEKYFNENYEKLGLPQLIYGFNTPWC
jgi:hypothetical protein